MCTSLRISDDTELQTTDFISAVPLKTITDSSRFRRGKKNNPAHMGTETTRDDPF